MARLFRDVLDARLAGAKAVPALQALVPHLSFSNGFFHGAEGLRFLRAPAER
ncbi:MAG: hypothetical protein IRY94_04530 [Rhodospirillaceae bacterium]|nr:hypothetical protein [Rhodospirillaceae bacterium]